jgi:2-dehydro-3-deoxy-D-arabinonate dehydratase
MSARCALGGEVRLCQYTINNETGTRFGLISEERVIDVAAAGGPDSLAAAMHMSSGDLLDSLRAVSGAEDAGTSLDQVTLRAPIDEQEVWAAGVTYLRSRDARMEESTQRDVYDQVYDADRPEIFFKATPNRVSGPGEAVAIRGDSGWDVPEPELVLLQNRSGELVGYTIGNDVSSRSIEGENPLYLPQAKLYSRSAALGPVIVTVDELTDPSNLGIRLAIRRNGRIHFEDRTSTSQLHRSLVDLTSYLFRANEFPDGVFLMTGTGIVPPSEFTLEDGDEVTIAIDGIGELMSPVVRLTQ